MREKFINWINFDLYDASEPFHGEVWGPAEHVETVGKLTKELGGARFTVYPIENVQGAVNLNNWEEAQFRRGIGDMGEILGELNMPLWSTVWTLFMNPTEGFWLNVSRSDPHKHWFLTLTFLS